MPRFRPNQKYAISFLLAAILLAVASPVLAQGQDQKTAAGAMALLSALLYAIPPWVTGLLLDFLIVRTSVVLWKGLATAVLSMVLGYPSIWFSMSSFLLVPGGPESTLAWVLCTVLLALTLGSVKVVSYWVVNEKFPTKKTVGLLFVSAIGMVVAAFICLAFMGKPTEPGAAKNPSSAVVAPEASDPAAAPVAQPPAAKDAEENDKANEKNEPSDSPTETGNDAKPDTTGD
ncbi:hypothetical protein KF728_19885 [Candidatus Obscuribacterales bacterium]|nr:hypothetical protein [Candidatus Obscuribacterales bacterium]